MKTSADLIREIQLDLVLCSQAGVRPNYLQVNGPWTIDLESQRVRWESPTGIAGAFVAGDFGETETLTYVPVVIDENGSVFTIVFLKDQYHTVEDEDADNDD